MRYKTNNFKGEKAMANFTDQLSASTPKKIRNIIEFLTEDRDRERDGLYNLRRYLETNHPEIIKEYDDYKLLKAINGEQ
jgi:hypothetical protein